MVFAESVSAEIQRAEVWLSPGLLNRENSVRQNNPGQYSSKKADKTDPGKTVSGRGVKKNRENGPSQSVPNKYWINCKTHSTNK